jgi:chromatin remodeling complex protein RSC6
MAKVASSTSSSGTPSAAAPAAVAAAAPAVKATPKVAKSASPAPHSSSAGGAAAPAAVKQPKQPKGASAASASASASSSGAPAVAAPVNATVEPIAESGLFAASHTKLQTLVSALASLRTELRGIERQVERELRAARKATDKKRRKNINRQPSGFVKPTLISNELAAFLGKSNGSEMARTEVTREINAYIRDKKLQDETNGRRILPDAKLKKLLKLKDDDELTYFNLQRFMSPHFSTAAKIAAAVAASAKA